MAKWQELHTQLVVACGRPRHEIAGEQTSTDRTWAARAKSRLEVHRRCAWVAYRVAEVVASDGDGVCATRRQS